MPGHQEDAVPARRIPRAMRGPHLGIRIDLPGLGSRSPGPDDQSQTEKSSGSVNRSSCPDSVRHMSVTTAMQRLAVAHHGT